MLNFLKTMRSIAVQSSICARILYVQSKNHKLASQSLKTKLENSHIYDFIAPSK